MMDWLITHWAGIGDWFIRTFLVGGVGYNAYRFIKDKRSRKALATIEETKSVVEGATVGNKIESSSITTLQAGQIAIVASFEAERTTLRDTIAFQAAQLAAHRERVAELERREVEKDRVIQELRDQVSDLQERIRHQASELTEIADRLCELQTKPQQGTEEA